MNTKKDTIVIWPRDFSPAMKKVGEKTGKLYACCPSCGPAITKTTTFYLIEVEKDLSDIDDWIDYCNSLNLPVIKEGNIY